MGAQYETLPLNIQVNVLGNKLLIITIEFIYKGTKPYNKMRP